MKIKKLDGELARYKEQMSKLRNGPGKVRFRLCARGLSVRLTARCRMRYRSVRCGR